MVGPFDSDSISQSFSILYSFDGRQSAVEYRHLQERCLTGGSPFLRQNGLGRYIADAYLTSASFCYGGKTK